MDDLNAFDRQLASAMVERAGPVRPVDDAAIFAAASAAGSRSWTFRSMFGGVKLVLAGAIVVLFGGFLLATVVMEPTPDDTPAVGASASPEATTIQPIRLPEQFPVDIESGTLDTPLGPARWIRLDGGATTLPSTLRPVPVSGGGFVTLEQTGPPKLWRSSDLFSWAPDELPTTAEGYGRLVRVDDTLWLVTSEPAGLWRSDDARAWTDVSLDRLPPPIPAGPWRTDLSDPLTSGGVTIVPFSHAPDGTSILIQLGGYCCTRVEPGVYRLTTDRGQLIGDVRFEETDSGIQAFDAEDGTELAFLEGVSLGFVDLLADERPAVEGLAVLEQDELVPVVLPDTLRDLSDTVFAIDDAGFVAYSLKEDGLVHVHRSGDGRHWTETDLIGDDPVEPTDIVGVSRYPRGGSFFIESEPHITEWTSSDGVTWESRQPPDQFGGEPFASGWIELQMAGNHSPWPGWEMEVDTLWYVPQAGEPVAMDVSELGIADPEGRHGMAVPISTDTLLIEFDPESSGPRDTWIITFDELPAAGA